MAAAMQGALFRYAPAQGGPSQAHVAFVTGNHRRHVILVGGLGDALLFAQYPVRLAEQLDAIGWSLVQPLLRSSLTGWGVASLDKDVQDMVLLTKHLKTAFNSERLVLAGHSTGCQDAVRYVNQQHERVIPAHGVILQAPVSDREYLSMVGETEDRIHICKNMIKKGQGEDIAFRDEDGTPVTARRFLSLATKGGDDDYFSSDFSREVLEGKLGAVASMPTLVLLSGSDECVPEAIDPQKTRHRFAAVLRHPLSKAEVIEGANHSLKGHEVEAVDAMIDFVKSLPA